ncbi:o-succinylbenzoate--CoA ligase [Bacillus sp. DJP31]|uniref:o-succinylbenzoate--CoA ligase n=1 Tax=Bacillus sp. DJP31 TaxID=3409789 RepID=UPI003BB62608
MTFNQAVPNWLMQRAYLTPERVAIKINQREITFQELHNQVLLTAAKLQELGVKKGSKIGLLSHNSVEMVEVLHALKYIGAITVMLNTRLTKSELLWQLKDAESECVFVGSGVIDIIKAEAPIPVVSFQTLFNANATSKNLIIQEEFHLQDLDTIMYTSGTTGNPKGVVHTYGNHYWSAIGSALNLGIHQDDCWLACVPFFHVSGLSILMKSVIYGMKVVLQDPFDPKQINKAIIEEKVTIISVVGIMLQQMIRKHEEMKTRYPESLRCVLLGGGPASKELLERSRDLSIPVYQTYGMTETASQIVSLSPEYSLSKLGSAGKPLFHSQAKIIRDGKEQPPMEVGEIVVKGPTVTSGYYNQTDATSTAIKKGWLSTGDMGYLDQEGFLFVLDRRKDLIISGGENVYPAEIEGVLISHPKIQDAGVIGIEDEKWGQVPVAFIVSEDLTTEELQSFCREKLAKYKVPKSVYFLDELPRNATKKLQRHKLFEFLGKRESN